MAEANKDDVSTVAEDGDPASAPGASIGCFDMMRVRRAAESSKADRNSRRAAHRVAHRPMSSMRVGRQRADEQVCWMAWLQLNDRRIYSVSNALKPTVF